MGGENMGKLECIPTENHLFNAGRLNIYVSSTNFTTREKTRRPETWQICCYRPRNFKKSQGQCAEEDLHNTRQLNY